MQIKTLKDIQKAIGTGFRIPEEIMRDDSLANGAKVLYGILAKIKSYDGTMEVIEEYLRISAETRRRYISQLVDAGLVTAKKEKSGYISLVVDKER